MQVLIIGGDAAGLKAAARLRRLRQDANIVVFERSRTISYAACGLPYYLSGDIDSFDSLVETAWGEKKSPEFFQDTRGIKVYTNSEVVSIDPEKKLIRLSKNAACPAKEWGYDALVLATGAGPIRAGLTGHDTPGVTCFTRPEEAVALRKALQANEIGRVAVIGAGYIGLELCEAFAALWGVEIELIEMKSQVLPRMLDPEMAAMVQKHLLEQGVHLHLGTAITAIRPKNGQLTVSLDGKNEIQVDRVIQAMGIRPNVSLVRNPDTDLVEIGLHGGILVDNRGRTSAPDIYAAGDCAELRESDGSRWLPLGSIANRLGRVVAGAIAGKEDFLPPLHGSAVVKVFDLNIAVCGDSAAALKERSLESESYWGAFPNKAHYYPESNDVRMKIVKLPGGKLKGIQAVGKGEVVRWIDAFSQVLDLADGDPVALRRFEHAYAPPFATPLDPFHYFAGMIEHGPDLHVSPEEIRKGGHANWTVLNLLSVKERRHIQLPMQQGRVIEMDLADLRRRYGELPAKDVVTICARGPRSYEAALFLRHHGVEARYVAGGVSFL